MNRSLEVNVLVISNLLLATFLSFLFMLRKCDQCQWGSVFVKLSPGGSIIDHFMSRKYLTSEIYSSLLNRMEKENKYFTGNVEQLKQKLKKRDLRTTGKKKFSKNGRFIFCGENKKVFQLHAEGPDKIISTPDSNEYRDINSKTKIPVISKNQAVDFSQSYNLHKTLGRDMCVYKYLLYARVAEYKNSTFIQGQCLAQMKISVQYNCDTQISSATGFIEGTHCECVVGSGDTAHCKHIADIIMKN